MSNRLEAQRILDAATATIKGNPQQQTVAYVQFAHACLADPDWDQTWFQHGNNNADLKWFNAAIACYRRALECNPIPGQKARILANLGWQLHQVGYTREALNTSLEAVDLDPSLASAWVNLSCIHGTLRNTAKALEAGLRAVRVAGPDDITARMNLAFAYLFDRQWMKGLEAFEIRYKYKLHHFLHYPYPQWHGEEGKTVLLVFDQGLGDTLSYARFVERAARRCRFMHICIQQELLRWLEFAFAHIDNIRLIPTQLDFPGDVDYWTTFVSLPHALGLTDQEFETAPQIKLPVVSRPASWKVANRKLHIGIAWAGSSQNEIDVHRSIPVEQFLELYRVPGIQLYSLQVDARREDLGRMGGPPLIVDLSGFIRDVSDTLGLMQHLDLIITCESALGHIASAARKECFIPYSYLGRDYRLGADGSRPIWSPRHRTFNQPPDRRWEGPFDEIMRVLRKRVK